MIRRSNRTIAYTIIALVALASMAFLPATALALSLERLDIQVDPTDSAGTLYIVTATLPAATPLPATIRLSMPQGSTVGWAGEVLGGPLENDPSVQPVIEHGENGYDTVSLTLTRGPRGQLELTVPGLLVQNGENRTLRAAYFTVDAADTVSIAALVPAGGVIETATPGAMKSPGPANGTILSLETSGTAGNEVVLDIRYTQSTVPASTTTGGSNTAVYVIFAVVVAAFALLIVAVNKRTRQRSASVDEDDADYSEPADEAVSHVAASETAHVADEPDGGSPVITSKQRLTPQMLIIAVVVVILGGAVVMMTSGESPGTTKSTNEYTYKVLTSADADATLTLPITLSEADPAHESTHVFEAVAGVAGIRSMKLTYTPAAVEIKYDSAQVDEAAIRSALTAGGYPPAGN